MKINSTGGLGQYKNYVNSLKSGDASARGQRPGGSAAAAKTDTVTISGGAASRAELSRMAAQLSYEVEQLPEARVSALRGAVQAGEYYVPAAMIADAILNESA